MRSNFSPIFPELFQATELFLKTCKCANGLPFSDYCGFARITCNSLNGLNKRAIFRAFSGLSFFRRPSFFRQKSCLKVIESIEEKGDFRAFSGNFRGELFQVACKCAKGLEKRGAFELFQGGVFQIACKSVKLPPFSGFQAPPLKGGREAEKAASFPSLPFSLWGRLEAGKNPRGRGRDETSFSCQAKAERQAGQEKKQGESGGRAGAGRRGGARG